MFLRRVLFLICLCVALSELLLLPSSIQQVKQLEPNATLRLSITSTPYKSGLKTAVARLDCNLLRDVMEPAGSWWNPEDHSSLYCRYHDSFYWSVRLVSGDESTH